MNFNLPVLAQNIRVLIENNQLDAGLKIISKQVIDILSDERSYANVFSSRLLDQLCQEIGLKAKIIQQKSVNIVSNDIPSFNSNPIVYLTTELSTAGGHSRVLFDLIKARDTQRHLVIMTNLHERTDFDSVKTMLNDLGSDLIIAPVGSYQDKLHWLIQVLHIVDMKHLYMLIHHFDSVSVAAIQEPLSKKTRFFHNCDHSLGLGVHLNCSMHIDFHINGFYNCREHLKVNNVYWPLVSQDYGFRKDRAFLKDGSLITCTSGGFEKFNSPHLDIYAPYLYLYEQVLPKILAITQGKHIHIGTLNDEILNNIYKNLNEHGINPDKFVYIPHVNNIWLAMYEYEIDLYICSFPKGGGKATVDVMGSGTPMIVHRNYRSIFFDDASNTYPQAWRWSQPTELFNYVKNITIADLYAHASYAREYYLKNNTIAQLQIAMDSSDTQDIVNMPTRPNHDTVDSLQTYLDFRNVEIKKIMSKQTKINEMQDSINEMQSKIKEQYNTIDLLNTDIRNYKEENEKRYINRLLYYIKKFSLK